MNAKEYSERAEKYFNERNFDGAIADYTEQIKIESDNPVAYCKRGMSYINKKEFDLAIADFTEAIRLEPNKFGNFYFERGLAYISKGDKALAISDFEMAVKIDPQNNDYHEALKDTKAVGSGDTSSSNSSVSTKSGETIKKEIKVILIGAIIGAIVGAVFLTVTKDFSMPLAFTIIFGAWMGLGVGGNIAFIPSLFIKGQTLFGFLDFGWWDSKSSFGINIFFFFFRLFLGLLVAWLGFIAFAITGPIWPLIRLLIKRGQIKKM